jgi:hypothetical protein
LIHAALHLISKNPFDHSNKKSNKKKLFFLKNETNINERDDGGLTALHVATATENLEMIKILGTFY